MKYFILIATLLFTACGTAETPQSQIIDTNITSDVPCGDKAYIFISMGQSNLIGVKVKGSFNALENVRMLSSEYNDLSSHPNTVTWSKFNANGHNLMIDIANDGTFYYNASVSLAEKWQNAHDNNKTNKILYIITIAKSGEGISPYLHDRNNGFLVGRTDADGRGYHSQAIDIIQAALDDFVHRGVTPVIVGFNWNQWESNMPFDDPDVKQLYLDFFGTFNDILPNEPHYYLYKPLSLFWGEEYRNIIRKAFFNIADERQNYTIIDPMESNITDMYRDDIKVHYSKDVNKWFGVQLFDKTIEWINSNI